VTSPAAAHVGTSSEAPSPAAPTPTGTNGHHGTPDEPHRNGHTRANAAPNASANASATTATTANGSAAPTANASATTASTASTANVAVDRLAAGGVFGGESIGSVVAAVAGPALDLAASDAMVDDVPVIPPSARPAHPASESRTADDVEAGIIALWHTYGESHQQNLRDRLVLHYAPLVKYVAGRVGTGLPAHVDVADLIQSGIFGLVDAIEKFEPERGLKFETYAMQRIRGAILDDLRSQDWVPRSVRSRARDVERALERLGGRLQRTPTDRELAAELKIGLAELRELYAQLQLTSVVALDELIAAGRAAGGAGGASLAESLPDEGAEDPIATLVDQDSRRQLADAIAQLAERDRVVVTLYYFENLTLAEIGKVLGVTESRVCQLHTRAVLRLRTKLNEQLDS
jgi:RNA polymerase sigma factor for flagellar operon FliA